MSGLRLTLNSAQPSECGVISNRSSPAAVAATMTGPGFMASRVGLTARTVLVQRGSVMAAYSRLQRMMKKTGLDHQVFLLVLGA